MWQHDRDTKFTDSFDRALAKKHVKAVRTSRCAPDCQAFVERFIGSFAARVFEPFRVLWHTASGQRCKPLIEHII